MKVQKIKFYIENYDERVVQDYVNYINDHDLCYELENFEIGYKDGKFFLDIEGKKKVVERIKSIEPNVSNKEVFTNIETESNEIDEKLLSINKSCNMNYAAAMRRQAEREHPGEDIQQYLPKL